MTRFVRYAGALLLLSLFVPLLPSSAVAADQAKPVAWLALRSYQRLEQRLREVSSMAQTPGLADMMLGMVQLQFAGLGGVDRQRPIGVALPTVHLTGQPPVAVLLPYTDREAILQTLRSFFPQTLVEDGAKLSLQGGPMPAFGRLDTQANVLVIASTPEALQGDLSMPPELFSTADEGPDLIFRVDIDTIKRQLDTAWQAMLTSMEQVWQKALQKAMDDKAVSAAEKTAMTAYMTLSQRALRQMLDDIVVGESRLTLAPQGWVFDLEARMRPGSPSAAFVNAQAGHTSRVSRLFAPNSDALLRMVYNVRMTDRLRQEMTALFPVLRQMLDAKLAALPTLTQEQRAAGARVIESYFGLLEQWYAEQELEAAAELRTQGTGLEVTGWIPFANSTQVVGTMLDMVEQVPLFTSEVVAKVTRDMNTYQGTAVHRVDLPKAETPDMPPSMFLATRDTFVTLHLGRTVAPLHGLIDRIAVLSRQAQAPTDAMAHVELFMVPLLELGMSKGQMGKAQDPTAQALIARLQQGPREPMAMDVLTRQNAATLRYAVPGSLVKGFAEVIGQQMTQQLRGGGEKKNGGVKPKTP